MIQTLAHDANLFSLPRKKRNKTIAACITVKASTLDCMTFANVVQGALLPISLVHRNILFLFTNLTDEEYIFYIYKKCNPNHMDIFKIKVFQCILFYFCSGLHLFLIIRLEYVCVVLLKNFSIYVDFAYVFHVVIRMYLQ